IKKTFSVGKSSTEQNFDEDFNIDWPKNKEISTNPYYYVLAVSSQDRSISMWTSLRNVPFLLLKGVSDSPVLDMKWVKNDLYFCTYSGKVVQLSFTEFDNPISINKKTSCKRDCVTNRKIVSEIISERDFDNYCIENDESMTSADKQEVVSKNASVNNLLENEIKISPIIKNGNKNINEISYDNSKNILLFKNKEYLIQGVTLIQNNKNYLILIMNNYIIRIYKIKENIIHLINEYLIYDILLIKLKKHLLLILTPKHFILFNIKENTTVKDEYYFKLDDKITLRNGLIITKDNKKYVYDESLRVFRKLKSIDKENPKYFSTKRLQKYLSNQSKRSVLEELSKRNKH
ncbi:hypothetical protein H311_04337, partial [Anncaliia algerae PRA109]